MSKLILFLNLVIFSFPLIAKDSIKLDTLHLSDVDPKKINHLLLMNLHELREDADQIPVAELGIEHAKTEADRALTRFQADKSLSQKQAIAEFDVRKSEMEATVKSLQVQIESLKVEDRRYNFEIKKQFIEDQLGRNPSVKETAQLLANQRKVRLEGAKLTLKKSQAELNFLDYHYATSKKLQSIDALSLDAFLDVIRDRNKAAETVATLTKYMVDLQKTYEESQELADSLSK